MTSQKKPKAVKSQAVATLLSTKLDADGHNMAALVGFSLESHHIYDSEADSPLSKLPVAQSLKKLSGTFKKNENAILATLESFFAQITQSLSFDDVPADLVDARSCIVKAEFSPELSKHWMLINNSGHKLEHSFTFYAVGVINQDGLPHFKLEPIYIALSNDWPDVNIECLYQSNMMHAIMNGEEHDTADEDGLWDRGTNLTP